VPGDLLALRRRRLRQSTPSDPRAIASDRPRAAEGTSRRRRRAAAQGIPLDLYQPDVFDRIRRERAALRTAAARELDDTPILAELAREGRLIGVVLRDGRLFDCGIPEGYRDAVDALGT
jgi:UTP-glucose-1-phosphate uridylyltransferase